MLSAKIAGNDELMFLLMVEKCGGASFVQSLKKLFKGITFPQARDTELNLNANFVSDGYIGIESQSYRP